MYKQRAAHLGIATPVTRCCHGLRTGGVVDILVVNSGRDDVRLLGEREGLENSNCRETFLDGCASVETPSCLEEPLRCGQGGVSAFFS